MIKTPIRALNSHAHAERWVRTVREECLDWLLIIGRRQLERVRGTYVDHYNRQRPHRALGLTAPDPPGELISLTSTSLMRVSRTDRLGGLLHEYRRAVMVGFMRPTGKFVLSAPSAGTPNSRATTRPG